MKTRTNAGETLNQLTDLESERNARDKEFLETWKSQSESNAAKNNAIIAASQSIGQVSLEILDTLKRRDSENSTVTHFKRICRNINLIFLFGVIGLFNTSFYHPSS